MRDSDLVASFREEVAPPREEVRIRARARLLETLVAGDRPAPVRRGPARRTIVGLAGLSLTLVTAVVLVVVAPWQPTGETTLARAATMVSPRPGTILHVRMQGHRIVSPFFEQWIGPDGSWRVIYGGTDRTGACIVEHGFDAATGMASTYDVQRRTIYSLPVPSSRIALAAIDPMAKVRSWLVGGRLRIAGETSLAGRRVIRLVPTRGTSLYGVVAYYVDAGTGQPVRWQVDATQWYDFTVFGRLPATKRTHRLVSLQARYPRSRLRHGWDAGGCAAG